VSLENILFIAAIYRIKLKKKYFSLSLQFKEKTLQQVIDTKANKLQANNSKNLIVLE
jgi:hypothetical protein